VVEPLPPNSIFLCYRRADSEEMVDRIYDTLAADFGAAAIFRDIDTIPAGVDFPTYIQEALRGCPVILVFIGREWASCTDEGGHRRTHDPGDHVRIEVETALAVSGARVIPVFVKRAEIPREDELPESLRPLRRRNGFTVRSVGLDYKQDVGRLREALAEAVREVFADRGATAKEQRRPTARHGHAPGEKESGSNRALKGAALVMASIAVIVWAGFGFGKGNRFSPDNSATMAPPSTPAGNSRAAALTSTPPPAAGSPAQAPPSPADAAGHESGAKVLPPAPLPDPTRPLPPMLVELKTNKTAYMEGEQLVVTVQASESGHLRLLYQDAAGEIYTLFPNQFVTDDRIEGGHSVQLMPMPNPKKPGDDIAIQITGPNFGAERLAAVVSDEPFTDGAAFEEQLRTAVFLKSHARNIEDAIVKDARVVTHSTREDGAGGARIGIARVTLNTMKK
jgi:hypothetical protein